MLTQSTVNKMIDILNIDLMVHVLQFNPIKDSLLFAYIVYIVFKCIGHTTSANTPNQLQSGKSRKGTKSLILREFRPLPYFCSRGKAPKS